jgi:hypothetical protein
VDVSEELATFHHQSDRLLHGAASQKTVSFMIMNGKQIFVRRRSRREEDCLMGFRTV